MLPRVTRGLPSLVLVLLVLLLDVVHGHAHLRRQMAGLPAPKDVYAVFLTNRLPSQSVEVNVTFVQADMVTKRVESVSLTPGESKKVGPLSYTEGTATFRYVVHQVAVVGVNSLQAPFQGISGVTPVLPISIQEDNASAITLVPSPSNEHV